MTGQAEFKAITCNYRTATRTSRRGAKAYVIGGWGGGAWERIRVIARSRGGRWIEKWENYRHFERFRLTTVVPDDATIYARLARHYPHAIGRTDREMREWCDYMNGGGWDASPYNDRRQERLAPPSPREDQPPAP